MRIFFFNAHFNPNRYEGARVHIEQLVTNLIEMGHEVWVPQTSPVKVANKLPNSRIKRLVQLRSMDIFYFRIEGRPIGLPRYLQEPWRKLGFEKKIVWEINAASDFVALARGFTEQSAREKLDAELSSQARDVDLAICNTNGLARFANDLGIKNTLTVPLGTVPEMFGSHVSPTPHVPRKQDCLNVVWCGNPHAPWHDFQTVRKAARELREDKSIRFYLIGESPPGIAFTDNVTSIGSVSYDQMPHYLSAMDVGLATYRNESWSRYGVFSSPLKLFDYFAAELAVIASPIEQVSKCIQNGENGFIIPFENEDALVDRLRFLTKHKEQVRYVGKRARDLAITYYNWRRVAKETTAAIQELFD